MDISNLVPTGGTNMDKVIQHLRDELLKIRAGKASPILLDGIKVDYYGSPTPLAQVANVSAMDSRTLSIQPWEKPMLAVIEQAIFQANLGLTPMNDGETIRISIPPLTEERRKDMVKQAKAIGEDSKVSIRNERQKLMNLIKAEVKDGFPEDSGKKLEGDVQKLVDKYNNDVQKLIDLKEKEILTV